MLQGKKKRQQRKVGCEEEGSSSNLPELAAFVLIFIRDDVKLAYLVRARDRLSAGRWFDSGKAFKKIENSNLHLNI